MLTYVGVIRREHFYETQKQNYLREAGGNVMMLAGY